MNFARLALIVTSLFANSLHAEVTLASIFRDGAVLQRDTAIPVWGQARPGDAITVQLAPDSATTTASAEGRWLVRLPARTASFDPGELIVQGDNRLVVRDVLIGDVWLCGGQSNMMMSVRGVFDAEREIAAAHAPALRVFKVGHQFPAAPADSVEGAWLPTTPENAPAFSATAYFFARKLQAALTIPIGLITVAYGNTSISTWRSPASMTNDTYIADWWHRQLKGKTPPRPHRLPGGGYNGMIAPLAPYAVRGFLWYQGEGDATETPHFTQRYAQQMTALIHEWRTLFADGQPAPFYWVQLAGYGKAAPRDFPGLREQQTQALSVPNTGQAIAIDLGDATDIHPRNKQEVGARLARLALKRAYGRDLIDRGPNAVRAESTNGNIIVHFDTAPLHATGELASAFEIADTDGKFVPADHAEISNSTVIVSCRAVAHPTAVRFAWQDLPQGFLFNDERLPVGPFQLTVNPTP